MCLVLMVDVFVLIVFSPWYANQQTTEDQYLITQFVYLRAEKCILQHGKAYILQKLINITLKDVIERWKK